MSNRYVFSEYIPKSQRIFLLIIFMLCNILLYRKDGKLDIKYQHLNSQTENGYAWSLKNTLNFCRSGYDEHILINCHNSLIGSVDKFNNEVYDNLHDSVRYYEIGMNMNISPLSVSKSEACQFIRSAKYHSEKLRIDLNDELFRIRALSCE